MCLVTSWKSFLSKEPQVAVTGVAEDNSYSSVGACWSKWLLFPSDNHSWSAVNKLAQHQGKAIFGKNKISASKLAHPQTWMNLCKRKRSWEIQKEQCRIEESYSLRVTTASSHGTGGVSQTRHSSQKAHTSPCASLDEQVIKLGATECGSPTGEAKFPPCFPSGQIYLLGLDHPSVSGCTLDCQSWVGVLLLKFTCLKLHLCKHPRAWLWTSTEHKYEKEVQ